ncbi:MAG TPA: hypothetical protein VLJ83_07935 [Gemmatimonadaceae bacterium]|nr:hypothetical protein [Gemmatimonadaceae bacterium]
MTEILSGIARRALAAATIVALASSVATAQTTPRSTLVAPVPDSMIPLSLGDAARLAARQSATAQGARFRADEAQARVRATRADLLPQLSSYVQEAGRTFNTSTLGIDFPSQPGVPHSSIPRDRSRDRSTLLTSGAAFSRTCLISAHWAASNRRKPRHARPVPTPMRPPSSRPPSPPART